MMCMCWCDFTDCSTDLISATAERVVACPSQRKHHAASEELTLIVNFRSKTCLCCDYFVLQLEMIVQLERRALPVLQLERHIYMIWLTVRLRVG